MGTTKEIVNRRASHEYHFLSNFEAGVVLGGSELKSIRAGHAGLTDAYCIFINGELWVKSMYIKEYENANSYSTRPSRRDRKLLLHKSELRKLEKRVKEKGLSIVPYKIYFSDRNFVKIEIALAQGKKSFDKRETIKEKDSKRDIDRMMKSKGRLS
ncbi:MAG: SsrA-binding protein SmpB [Saprospiraceae bacterium]|nr:SsrA-binding protein SmpB [Saprospiraceae bacterium]